jgi:hypothetical protein
MTEKKMRPLSDGSFETERRVRRVRWAVVRNVVSREEDAI